MSSVNLLSGGAAQGLVGSLASAFKAQSGFDIMGEFGALRTDARYVAAPNPDRARYIADVRQGAEDLGFGWAFWNLFDGMGMMDDTTRALDPDVIAALGLTMPAD